MKKLLIIVYVVLVAGIAFFVWRHKHLSGLKLTPCKASYGCTDSNGTPWDCGPIPDDERRKIFLDAMDAMRRCDRVYSQGEKESLKHFIDRVPKENKVFVCLLFRRSAQPIDGPHWNEMPIKSTVGVAGIGGTFDGRLPKEK